MNPKVRFFILLGIVILITGAVVYVQFVPKQKGNVESEITGVGGPAVNPPAAPLPPATGNIDDLVGAILQGASAEQSILNEGDGDASAINLDNKEIGDIGQSFNENEF